MTACELSLLITLAFRLRALTRRQAMRLLGLSNRQQRRLVRRLERRGLVRVRRALVAEPTPSDGPVASWMPGQPMPDLAKLSYLLRSRPTAPTFFADVIMITDFAARRLGGVRPNIRLHQLSHDVALAEALIFLVRHEPDRAERFVGEDLLRRRFCSASGTYTPDAAVVTPDGRIEQVIEFGRYDTERMCEIHRGCEAADVAWRLF